MVNQANLHGAGGGCLVRASVWSERLARQSVQVPEATSSAGPLRWMWSSLPHVTVSRPPSTSTVYAARRSGPAAPPSDPPAASVSAITAAATTAQAPVPHE